MTALKHECLICRISVREQSKNSLTIENQNEKKILENANLNAEVNFLKSQINPHFLFNTLNGIYSLAHNRSAQTETAILKLSDLSATFYTNQEPTK